MEHKRVNWNGIENRFVWMRSKRNIWNRIACIPSLCVLVHIYVFYVMSYDFYRFFMKFQFNTNSFTIFFSLALSRPLLRAVSSTHSNGIQNVIQFEQKKCINTRFFAYWTLKEKKTNEIKSQWKKIILEQMQTHCQYKHKQISFVLYRKIKDITSCCRWLFDWNMKIIYHSIKMYV